MKTKRIIPFALAMLLAMLPCHSALGIGLITLNVSPQKQAYSVGETVTVSIPDSGYSQTVIYVVTPDSNYQTVNNGSAITLNQAGTWALRGYALTADGEKLYTPENILLEVEGKDGETDTMEIKVKPEKLPDPVVTLNVEGTSVTASWNAVEGAERYVYSLVNVTDDVRIYNHKAADGRTLTFSLETGKKYRLAVAAVPEYVKDTQTETGKCSWKQVEFEIPAEARPDSICQPSKTDESKVSGLPTAGTIDEVKKYVLEPDVDNNASYKEASNVAPREVQRGTIRYIPQVKRNKNNQTDPTFCDQYWKSENYDFVKIDGWGECNKWCTRAAFSMTLSYLGIDCTPVYMSELKGNDFNVNDGYEKIVEELEKKNNIQLKIDYLGDAKHSQTGERFDDKFYSMYKNYLTDESFSPIYVRFTEQPHAMVIISKSSENDNIYYAVDSSFSIQSGKLIHVIEVEICTTTDGMLIMGDGTTFKAYRGKRLNGLYQYELIE